MTRAIHKYSPLFGDFHRDNSVLMDLPVGAEALYAATQRNEIVFYAIVNPEEKATERRRVYIYGTGYPLHHSTRAQALGVCSLHAGSLMFHVFIEPEGV